MARRRPSLNGLRDFEAAGRHRSFTAAAQELNVTQTAVSRMVRLLEQRLGFPLFRRHVNALELTAQGGPGTAIGADGLLRLDAPTLAVNWLIPAPDQLLPQPPQCRGANGHGRREAPGARRLDLYDTDTDAWPGYALVMAKDGLAVDRRFRWRSTPSV